MAIGVTTVVSNNDANVTTHTITLPGSINSGDLLIIFIATVLPQHFHGWGAPKSALPAKNMRLKRTFPKRKSHASIQPFTSKHLNNEMI